MLMVTNNFKYVCKEIGIQCSNRQLKNSIGFMELLKNLKPVEKYLVAKQFCNAEWNCGSLAVLGIFQQLRLLTATEFIISIQQNDNLQLILNDFFEAEHELITNLFISLCYDTLNCIALGVILEDALRGLFKDLLINPSVNNLQYLETIKKTLPADSDAFSKVIQKHINIILELHKSNVREAFRHFSSWINEGVDDIQFTKLLCEKLICNKEHETLNYLFKISATEHFKEWKFYLILLQTIASRANNETTLFIKKYFKSRLHNIATLPSKQSILHLLLSVRAATATTLNIEKNINAYADWYKENICEMKFVMDTEHFQNIINTLNECVNFEQETQYIEVHAMLSISPPVLCGKLVQNYKSKCKSRLSQIEGKKENAMLDPEESILINDSE